MNASLFKKCAYLIAVITMLTVGYLAFVRKHSESDSAVIRNAKFLGLKTSPASTKISNQGDLNIDGNKNDTKNDTKKDSAKDSSAASTNQNNGIDSGLYTVKDGDTYGCISEKYYGSYEHWTDILDANSRYGKGFSEYELHVGAVLEMPGISTDNLKPKSNLCS